MELVVNPDGSGETRSVLIFTADQLEALAGMGGATDDLCSGMQAAEGAAGETSMVQEARGDEIACVGIRAFGNLDEMDRDEESLVVHTARIANGRFVYDADLTPAGDPSEGLLGMSDLQVQELFREIYFRITAPGPIDQVDSNADSYEGNAATWNLAFGEARNVHLESRAS
jgi:hypothetical protein